MQEKKKELLLLATELVKTIPDISNATKYYRSTLKKNTQIIT